MALRHREDLLDILRGLFVFIMILAHAIYFFSTGNSLLLNSFGTFGNTVAFTGFLFVSGAATYFAYIKPSDKPSSHHRKHFFKRLLYILVGYYVIASVAIFSEVYKSTNTLSFEELGRQLLNAVLFIKMPSFAEFLVPFVLYALTIPIFKKVYRNLSKSLVLTITISVVLFALAYVLYPVNVASPIKEFKALFVGAQGLNRFPIFQYYPVYLLGLFWGRYLFEHIERKAREKKALIFGAITLGILLLSSFLSSLYPIAILGPSYRWPPSVGFLAVGLSFVFFAQVIYSNLKKSNILTRTLKLFDYMGRDAFDLFITSTVLLYFYQLFTDFKSNSLIVVTVLFILLLVLSILLSSINYQTSPSILSIKNIKLRGKGKYRPKKRHLLTAVAFASIAFININLHARTTTVGEDIRPQEIIGGIVQPLEDSPNEPYSVQPKKWYDNDYRFYQQLVLENTDPIRAINKGDFAKLHSKQLIDDIQKNGHGSFKLVYYLNDGFTDINNVKIDYKSAAPSIVFEVKNKVYPGKLDNRYFLFYGNGTDETYTSPDINEQVFAAYNVRLGKLGAYPIQLTSYKHWVLKTPLPGESENILPITLSLSNKWQTPQLDEQSLMFEIKDKNIIGSFEKVGVGEFQASVDAQALDIGAYTVKAYAKNVNGTKYQSAPLIIHVSEPILAAWTVDWEGWDVSPSQISSLEQQTKRHNDIPLTHFFNPRIYITNVISKERAQYLTNWVLNRKQNLGEEIELHMHMHFDMLEAAGITPHTSPRWGSINNDGYDVETTSYSYEDFSKLLKWAKNQFDEHGLGTPIGYRAGGWFVDEHILKALQDNGFVYDSSARDHLIWGRVESPWNATSTTQPYYPSKEDQNVAGNLPDNTFKVLEIPNNGADSYAYSATSMIARFKDNYDKGEAPKKKAIVFLSHPQTQQRDEPRMEDLLDYIDNYLYEQDKGPVVWVTLSDIEKLWRNEKLVNK